MADEGGQTSIAARIAALKLDHVGRAPGGPPPPFKRNIAPPEADASPSIPSERPENPIRQQSTNVPPLNSHHTSAASSDIGNQPADNRTNGHGVRTDGTATPTMLARPAKKAPPPLPARTPSGPAPQLPPRRPSEMSLEAPKRPDFSNSSTSRRPSTDSVASAMSTASSLSRVSTRTGTSIGTVSSGSRHVVKAPEYDPSKLPPLPPKRVQSDTQTPQAPAPLNCDKSSQSIRESKRAAPPPLPARKGTSPSSSSSSSFESVPVRPVKPAGPKQSALSMGFNNPASVPAPSPDNNYDPIPPAATTAVGNVPPPVPLASRPDLSKLQASKPKMNGGISAAPTQSQQSCLKCRDFSAIDAHAARFPRQSIPSTDLGWLANQLTAPFDSRTDKARALFTWLHHNIDYDTVAFYNNCVKPSTPASTLSTGLAVCEGYAGLFTALASKCGLESVVVGGHGKGYGYSSPGPNAPLPPYNPGGHAWNAVKIDNDKWKLIDCCWGAGAVGGPGQPYSRGFSPHHFTRDNVDFGLSHFPADQRHFYREDGRPSISWEEYILGPSNGLEQVQMFNGFTSEEGIAVESFRPLAKHVKVCQQPKQYVRFQFQKVCRHWNNEVNGRGKHYVYILEINGVDGGNPRQLAFDTDGLSWWVDVRAEELGAPGQQVKIAAVNSFDNGDGRGVSVEHFRSKVGRCSMGWGYVALYELV